MRFAPFCAGRTDEDLPAMNGPRLGRRRFLLGAAAAALAPCVRPAPAGAADAVWVGRDRWLFPAWESLTDPGDAAIGATLDLIRSADAMFASRGVGLLVAVVPFKARYYESELPAGMVLGEQVKSRYARVLEWLGQRGIRTVDLDAAIRTVATGDQTIYYHTDQHWTAWSAEAAALACAGELRKGRQLTGDAGGGDKLGSWMTEKHLGDLTTLLPKAEQANLGDETYIIRQPYNADLRAQNIQSGNDLLPAGDIPVHVVGNSFSRPNWGLPQRLSNALDRPVGLTWLRGDVGPWQIMLNYVESAKFKTPPNAIVWQLNEGQLPFGPTAPNYWFAASQMAPDVWLSRMKIALGG
jgi:alginate O-acetyltransferase complex protein AlgJ